jgi:hypothetical protein
MTLVSQISLDYRLRSAPADRPGDLLCSSILGMMCSITSALHSGTQSTAPRKGPKRDAFRYLPLWLLRYSAKRLSPRICSGPL